MTKRGILVAVDGSAESDAAVRWAAREAVMRDAAVTLMHVVAPVVVPWPVRYLRTSFSEWQEETAQHAIEQAQKIFHAEVGNAKLPPVMARVFHDNVAPGLVGASRDAEMIVVGSHGLRRGVPSKGGSGCAARVERRRSFARTGHGLARVRGSGP